MRAGAGERVWFESLSPADSPLIGLELREKDESVAHHETKWLVYKPKVLGQSVTPEVRLKTKKVYGSKSKYECIK